MNKNQRINDFANIEIDLESLSESVSEFDFPGENTNQDPCFPGGETGFEHGIYGSDNKMLHGYTVFFSLYQDKRKKSFDRYMLQIVVEVFDDDFDGVQDTMERFSLTTSIADIQKRLLEIIKEELSLFEANVKG